MKLRVMIAVLACKLCRSLIRLLGRGGTDFPGRVALKLCPNLLGELAKNVTTVIVTGTNGKTTTSRMIEQSWQDAGISYFANKSGANLLSGVTAEFAVHSTLTGRCKYPYALIEADEAALKFISKYVDAKVIVFTNVFRDQLDRYGEVTHTLEKLRIGAKNSPNAVLCLNADDSLITSLHDDVPNPVLFYGVSTPIYAGHVAEVSDAPYCIKCKSEYEYDFVTYGHLGGYRCPHCGYARPTPDLCVSRIVTSDEEHSEVVFRDGQTEIPASINLPGGYNIYNACAAMTAAKALGLDLTKAAQSLSHFACGFGRMEKFEIGGADVRMILIKNPCRLQPGAELPHAAHRAVRLRRLPQRPHAGRPRRQLDLGCGLRTPDRYGCAPRGLSLRHPRGGHGTALPLRRLPAGEAACAEGLRQADGRGDGA